MNYQKSIPFKKEFEKRYPYIEIAQLDNKLLQRFLNQAYIAVESLDRQLDMCQDWILANGLTEIQE